MSRFTLFSVRNRALIALATLFSVLAGLWSATSLSRELFPSLQFPVLVVATTSPGSSSSVVEQQVTRPVEIAAQGLNNVVEVTSTSADSFSTVIVELDYGTDLGGAQTDLQRAVLALPNLPDNANPQIFAGNLDDFPIIQLAVSGGSDGQDLVDRLERFVIPDIEDIDGVRSATLSGVADRVITVDLDEEAAAAAGVTVPVVSQLLASNGVILPGGRVLDGHTELPVQIGTRLSSVEEIKALPLLTAQTIGAQQEAMASGEGMEVPTLGEVAEVTLAERPATAYTRTNGEPSVGLAITKTPDGNAVDISHALAELTPELVTALDGGELVVIADGAPFIEQSIEDLTIEGLLGLAFAVLVVLVFLLSVRLTFVTALSIPLSLLIALVVLQFADYSLNLLTLGALTISVGRVVDDSIVVIENIKRHLGMGKDRRRAVVEATGEVAGAITSATICTVAVFLPLGFVGGQVGELFRPFALTVTAAMMASLLVALTIIPVLGYWLLAGSASAGAPAQKSSASKQSTTEQSAPAKSTPAKSALEKNTQTEDSDAPDRLQRSYLPTLRWTLAHPWITLGLAALLLGGTVWGATALKTDFIGDSGENSLSATLTLPTGSTLEDTDEQARAIEEWLAQREDVASYQVTAGDSGGIEALFLGTGANSARFALTLAEGTDGRAFGAELVAAFDPDLPEGGSLVTAPGQQLGATNLEVRVQAQDEEDLRAMAEEVTTLMREVGGADVANNLTETIPVLRVTVDRAAAAEAGLVEAQLGQVVQAATTGASVGRVELDGQQISVEVRQGEAEDLEALTDLVVAVDPLGQETTLGQLAELEQVQEAISVTRIDGVRAATVTARSTADDLGALTADLQERVDALEVPEGVQVSIAGVSAEQQKAFAALGLALLAAIAIVYLVMVATFNSLVQPLILLVSVPFAATGSVGMLLLTDNPLDIASMIGLLMLIGIVVTNAIVLIDLVNKYRARGLDRTAAVIEGARHRLRPILMTAAATILALTPMAMALTGGGAFISQPLALVVIGGLITSTLLTLILVPVLYELVERGAARIGMVSEHELRARERAQDRTQEGSQEGAPQHLPVTVTE